VAHEPRQPHPDADPIPLGLRLKPGVEYGCGKATCRSCYEPIPTTHAAWAVDLATPLVESLAAGTATAKDLELVAEAARYALHERRHDFSDSTGHCARCRLDIDDDNADLAAPEAHCNGGA
jgi:hypothetical protein